LASIAFLGQPRSPAAAQAVESPSGMTVPLVVLASLSIGSALAPSALVRVASAVTGEILAIDPASAIPGAALGSIAWLNAALFVAFALFLVLARVLKNAPDAASAPTWDCGYARPSERMQYTARSFSEMLSEHLLPKSLRPRVSMVGSSTLFPGPAVLSSDSSDPLTRGFYEPFFLRWGDRLVRLRWLQQGILQVYFVYILATAVLALAWTSVSTWLGR
jgi:hydrogenase-4 component B